MKKMRMPMKFIIIWLTLFFAIGINAASQDKKSPLDSFPDTYLDTVQVKKKFMINDYSLLGVQYGASLSMTSFNPSEKQSMLFNPRYFGITYTKYGKLFGYMPYFGFQTGLMYGHEGYKFKKDKTTDQTYTLEGATQAVMDVVEVPVLAQLHIDFWHMRLMGSAGIYGGYRLNIERTGTNVDAALKNEFKDTDIRIDYGLKGGIGIAFIFDPLEIHLQGMVKSSWSSLYQPDYYSQYYYRFAYPFDVIITAGIQYQLTRRTGKTNHQLRREAYDKVYGTPDVKKPGKVREKTDKDNKGNDGNINGKGR